MPDAGLKRNQLTMFSLNVPQRFRSGWYQKYSPILQSFQPIRSLQIWNIFLESYPEDGRSSICVDIMVYLESNE